MVYLRISKHSNQNPDQYNRTEGFADVNEDVDTIDTTDYDDEDLSLHAPPPCNQEIPHSGHEVLINFDIVHSPAYQVPVLYLTCRSVLPGATQPGKLLTPDEIFETVIATDHKEQFRQSNALHAFSATDHPITNLPVCFVHPCRTAEAMESIAGAEQSPVAYLIAWIGLIGQDVGLHVPVWLARSLNRNTDMQPCEIGCCKVIRAEK